MQQTQSESTLVYIILFGFMGFISGLPYLLITNTLQQWLIESGGSNFQVTTLVAATLPFAAKPLLAFSVDTLRRWRIIDYQEIFILCAVVLGYIIYRISLLSAVTESEQLYRQMFLYAGMASLVSNYLDIVIDGLRVVLIPPRILAIVNVWATAAYRVAMAVSGGVALYLVKYLQWRGVYQTMALSLLLLTAVTTCMLWYLYTSKEQIEQQKQTAAIDKQQYNLGKLYQWLTQPTTIYLIAFGLCLRMHEMVLSPVFVPFITGELGYSRDFLASLTKVAGMTAAIFGGFVSSLLMKHWPERNFITLIIVLELCASIALIMCTHSSTTAIGLLAAFGLTYSWRTLSLILGVLLEHFTSGLATTAIVVLFLRACDKHLAASQYAILTSLIFFARALAGPMVSSILKVSSYHVLFLLTCLPLLPLCLLMQSDYFKTVFGIQRDPELAY